MRLKRVLKLILIAAGIAAIGAGAGAQAFRDTDWLLYRGSVERVGHNAGDNPLPPPKKGQFWVWPPSRDMGSPMVVDNGPEGGTPPLGRTVEYLSATGQAFNLFPAPPAPGTVPLAAGSRWQYVLNADRAPGAWPSEAQQPPNDTDPTKVGDYLYAFADYNVVLHQLVDPQLRLPPAIATFDNLDRLLTLPDVDTSLQQNQVGPPYNGRNLYKVVNDELTKANVAYARWSFGTQYPVGSVQGTHDVSNANLPANQRYAAYIRFPSSPTVVNGAIHPNTNFVFVRVSWGANVDDPITSRIFLMDFSKSGATWYRIRSSRNEDRYFPYDGVNPLRVTVYTQTFSEPNESGLTSIVPVDAVRLVPESQRGAIHAPAVSAFFPAGDPAAARNRTYFARDETTGPRNARTLAEALASPPGAFQPIPFDPTAPPNVATNPTIADQTDSITSAVFYCFEDDLTAGAKRYGRMVWRYPASASPITQAIQDDDPLSPNFTITPGFTQAPGAPGVDQSFGVGYHIAATVAPPFTDQANWTATVPAVQRYSVYAWIPTGNAITVLAQAAHYHIATDTGPLDFTYDQDRAAITNATVMPPDRNGDWHLIASGIRFDNGNANLTLYNDSATDAAAGRVVAADAVMFISESQTRNSVVASPLLASVTWPSGTTRQVVYFVTTGGQIWAMDANGVGGASTNTSAFWVYPSVSNPDLANYDLGPAGVPNGVYDGEIDDPNFQPELTATNKPGFDGDIEKTTVTIGGVATTVYKINENTRAPRFSGFNSSPAYVESTNAARTPYIVVGNNNGRIYAIDPVGRVNTNPVVGTVGDPFPVTFSTANQLGVPGTSFREMTWPTIKRDRWIKQGAPGFVGRINGANQLETGIKPFKDDANKIAVTAAPTIPLVRTQPKSAITGIFPSDTVIAGTLDGHVYAIAIDQLAATADRMTTQKWQFPSDKVQLDPITFPGALTLDGRFIFSSSGVFGGRVYGIDPNALTQGVAQLDWVFPFTSAPPGNPKLTDLPGEQTAFTAPAWLPSVDASLNGGNEVTFVGNTDGRIFALDSTKKLGGSPTILWQYPRQFLGEPTQTERPSDPTRSSVVFINALTPFQQFVQAAFGSVAPPALLLGLDTGSLLGVNCLNGEPIWSMPDGSVGLVPVTSPTGLADLTFTSIGRRAADVTIANNFMFEGDEGIVEGGEVNGQMRAYGDRAIGLVTEGEREFNPEQVALDIRMVDLWDSPTWDHFGLLDPAVRESPFNTRGKIKQPTQSTMVVYEWGDMIQVAAWGAFIYDPADPTANKSFPQVTFTLSSRNGSRTLPPVGAVLDLAYVGPPLVMVPGVPNPAQVMPWVAKLQIRIDRGSPEFSFTSGDHYTIFAEATINNQTASLTTVPRIALGQFIAQPNDPAVDPNRAGEPPRRMALANPITISTRGSFPNVSMVGMPNIIGWTSNYPIDDLTGNLSEVIMNGNRLANANTLNEDPTIPAKDIRAPFGPAGHGTSSVYLAIDNNGNKGAGFYVADRSNFFKTGQRITNVRADRSDAKWGWDPNNTGGKYSISQFATGNVMNPLPWEVFPNTLPNVSPDYPDVARTRVSFRANGIDMGVRGISLPWPDTATTPGNKILSPVPIDMQVDVPAYQPANVNRDYFDINNTLNPNLPNGLLSPMMVSTGTDPLTANSANLKGLIGPSAGYVGRYVIFIDDDGNGRLDSRTANPQVAAQQGIVSPKEEVYRTIQAGFAVLPDTRLRTEEETIDAGKEAHSTGYWPTIPFAPSGVGPYSVPAAPYMIQPFTSIFDTPGSQQFFFPFTVKNMGNVNLQNVRLAKMVGDYDPNTINDPNTWLRLKSDQVQPLQATYDPADPRIMFGLPSWLLNSPVSGIAYNYVPASGIGGTIGVVSTLDHSNRATNFEIDYFTLLGGPNFFPMDRPVVKYSNPYVPAGNALTAQGWAAGVQPRPTLHKANVGDSVPTTLTVPDVAHGDPQSLLADITLGGNGVLGREVRPKVGLAIPLGTPNGVYSVPVYVFEDNIPTQWRDWMYFYNGIAPILPPGSPGPGDDDGRYTIPLSLADTNVLRESASNPPFTLKVTVMESRLTNGQSPGTYPHLDNRAAGATAFGANVQPAVWKDRGTGNLFLYFASNRLPNNVPLPALPSPDMPWYLFFTQLNVAKSGGSVATLPFDWMYEPFSGNKLSWWKPVDPAAMPYPASLAIPKGLFPSESGDVLPGTNSPVVPGVISPATERHASPGLAQDDDPAKTAPDTWVFWQGVNYKTGAAGGNNFVMDTRTFYQKLAGGGSVAPLATPPYSFLNDPALQKFGPKPLIMTDRTGKTLAFLFWYGGPQGRTRLYFNANATDLTDVKQWSRDEALATPGSLQWQSDPHPVHRQLFIPDGAGGIRAVDAIDVIYTGVLPNQKQSETILTRYLVNTTPNGRIRLDVLPLTQVDNELMVRLGTGLTWQARDLAWIYRDPVTRDFVDGAGKPPYIISVKRADGTIISPVTQGNPTFDQATNRIYFNSALGGQMFIDTQSGSVTFTSVGPRSTDKVLLTYVPQSMRLNVTRPDSNVVQIPAGFENDPGFVSRGHIQASGANNTPVAFMDRSPNPRDPADPTNPLLSPYTNPAVMINGSGRSPTTRLWLLYRKTNANVTSPAGLYFKTMRLMVRLPKAVILDITNNGGRTLGNHVRITGNRGPVEVDWVRGRLYFTEADESNTVHVGFDYARDSNGAELKYPDADYRVNWGDENTVSANPADQTSNEVMLPTDASVNEGQVSAFKDPNEEKVWIFWSSTRAGTTDLYYMTLSPQFYPQPGF